EASAEDGAAAVVVDYDPLPVISDPEAALRPDSPPARVPTSSMAPGGGEHAAMPPAGAAVGAARQSPNVRPATPMLMGDIEAGLREAEVVVEGQYRTHPVHQSYLEPQSVTVAPSLSGHQLVIWSSAQGLFAVRSAVARALALPERQIRVEPVFIGG